MKTLITDSDRITLASNLAHEKLLAEWESDERTDPIYQNVDGGQSYTEVAQDIFNEHYDYFCGHVTSVFIEADPRPTRTDDTHPWRFVEEHYPRYHSSQEIADSDDLQKIMDNEYGRDDSAGELWYNTVADHNGDEKEALKYLSAQHNELLLAIYERSIEEYLQAKTDTFGSNWGLVDIIERAKERELTISREQAREIGDWIDQKHDANIGINWDVIDIYTDNFLEKETNSPK